MDSDHSCLVTMVLDSHAFTQPAVAENRERFVYAPNAELTTIVHGTDRSPGPIILETDQYHSPEHLLVRQKAPLLRSAARALKRWKIDKSDLDAEDVVSAATVQFWQSFAHVHAPGDTINEVDFMRLMTVIIARVVGDHGKRTRAYKRGGRENTPEAGAGPEQNGNKITIWRPRRRDLELGELVSPEPPVDEVVAAKLEYEALLELLPDQLARAVFELRYQDHAIVEVAEILNVTRQTVARKIEDVQNLFEQRKTDRNRRRQQCDEQKS